MDSTGWSFYTIANELYHNDYEIAVNNLLEYSGVEVVKTILRQQFFDRSRIIRCAKIMRDLQTILLSLRERKLYDLRKDVENREAYLGIIDTSSSSAELKQTFRKFVTAHVCTKRQYDSYVEALNELILEIEKIWLTIAKVDQESEALLLLDKKRDFFSPNTWKNWKFCLENIPINRYLLIEIIFLSVNTIGAVR